MGAPAASCAHPRLLKNMRVCVGHGARLRQRRGVYALAKLVL